MRYEFYYKIKDDKEHISYVYYNEEGDSKRGIIGSTKKLIEFIKRNCLICVDVYFDSFDSNKVLYILNQVSDVIEIYSPSIGSEGPYQMLERRIKQRGK